jgi:tetratricopeptide (TPR) repeat protein
MHIAIRKTAGTLRRMTPRFCISATIAFSLSAALAETPPSLPISPAVPPASKPTLPESLPLVPGGGKVVPPSAPINPGATTQSRNPSDASTYPERYRALLGQAMSSFHARDFRGAIAAIEKADVILPPTPWSLNVRGAVAIEQRQWDDGIRNCVEALRIDPNFFPAKFNLCEIPFYQGKYAESRTMWEKLLAQQPKDELLIYRIFLTYLLEGDVLNSDTWLKKLPFPSETPAYQYGHAALYLHAERAARDSGDGDKAKASAEKAAEWIKSAEFIWPESKRASFIDVLMQLGWMKREELPTQ